MSYISTINAGIEWIRAILQGTFCLYDSYYNLITFRDSFRCIYCGEIKRIARLRAQCNKCDRAALKSGVDHEYDCPFGLKEGVLHVRLSHGAVHAIMGKRRPKTNELAVKKLREAIAGGSPLNFDRMMAEYEKIPVAEEDFEEYSRLLKETIERLRDENRLSSFENETVMRAICIMRRPKFTLRKCAELYPLLYLSEPAVNRIFWENCGETFSDFLRERCMLLAEDRLINSNDSIMEIAKLLDYDHTYFQTLFKNFCSMTPNDFRKNGFRGIHPLHLPF